MHPLGIAIELDDGPPDKASIGDTYAGRELPSEIAELKGNMTRCPTTGKMTSQEDNNQNFLVLIAKAWPALTPYGFCGLGGILNLAFGALVIANTWIIRPIKSNEFYFLEAHL